MLVSLSCACHHLPKRRCALAQLTRFPMLAYAFCLLRPGRPDLGPVFHACTSTTYKRTLGMFYSACCAYLNARPPSAVGWVVPKAYHIDSLVSDAAFRSRCVALSVKLDSMGAALRFAGQKAAAKKARMRASCITMSVFSITLKMIVCASLMPAGMTYLRKTVKGCTCPSA